MELKAEGKLNLNFCWWILLLDHDLRWGFFGLLVLDFQTFQAFLLPSWFQRTCNLDMVPSNLDYSTVLPNCRRHGSVRHGSPGILAGAHELQFGWSQRRLNVDCSMTGWSTESLVTQLVFIGIWYGYDMMSMFFVLFGGPFFCWRVETFFGPKKVMLIKESRLTFHGFNNQWIGQSIGCLLSERSLILQRDDPSWEADFLNIQNCEFLLVQWQIRWKKCLSLVV